jgi:hypothetical protein
MKVSLERSRLLRLFFLIIGTTLVAGVLHAWLGWGLLGSFAAGTTLVVQSNNAYLKIVEENKETAEKEATRALKQEARHLRRATRGSALKKRK